LPSGGFEKFYEMGHEDSTIATWLQAGGYRTALVGKYLNNYGADDPRHVPVGWNEWYALAGKDIPYYNYRLNENGEKPSSRNLYYDKVEDYQTDVLASKAESYVQRAAGYDKPFFLYLAPKAPHTPLTPAPRHQEEFAELRAPRPPSFAEDDVRDKPSWARRHQLTPEEIAKIDDAYRNRLRMLLAVDEMISRLVEVLKDAGKPENTYIVFSSDNGYHLGEHQLPPNKRTAYEEDLRVPLIVRGPGVPAGQTLDQFALNIDLAPTFAELAGAPVPASVDGRALVPLLTGEMPATWRSTFLLEGWNDVEEDSAEAADQLKGMPDYKAMRTAKYKYVEYDSGEKELYDLEADPYELDSIHDSADSSLTQDLKTKLDALRSCAGDACREAEYAP